MLTKDEIKNIKNECEENGLYFNSEIAIQALEAIGLAAENERLKSEIAEHEQCFYEQGQALAGQILETERLRDKLEAVRKWATTQGYGTANMSCHKAQEQIIAIIDKEDAT